MTGELNTAQNITVIKRKKSTKSSKIHKQYQSKQCLMDTQSETSPNSVQQIRITMQKQEWINSF